MASTSFSGFPRGTRKFLGQLAANNDRTWFAANKPRHEEDVVAPALAFIEAMRAPLERISPHFTAVPSRTGGSLMRIYRDTRFGADKTPYKTNIGIQFRHEAGKDVHAPGFYVHIEAKSAFLGAGLWHPERDALAAIRTAIATDPPAWKKARGGAAFRRDYELAGESLQRPPRGFDRDSPVIEDLKRKDFIGVVELRPTAVEARDFAAGVARRFSAAKGFMRFLCEAVGVDF